MPEKSIKGSKKAKRIFEILVEDGYLERKSGRTDYKGWMPKEEWIGVLSRTIAIVEKEDKDESKKPCKELLTSFGLIPRMPNRLSACGRCIIAVSPKFGHHAEPRTICMPHQLYVEKLEKLLEEGEVFIFTASKGYKVKKDGKRVWIE